MHVLHIFLGCHKQNSLPLGPIQPSPPSTKEFHELSINSRRVSHPVNNQFIVTRFTSVFALVLDPISSFYVYSFICTYLPTYLPTYLYVQHISPHGWLAGSVSWCQYLTTQTAKVAVRTG